MKIINLLTLSIVSLLLTDANAQPDLPKGFKKGRLELADGTNLAGYIKDNIRSTASVAFMPETGGKKKSYEGSELNNAEIEDTKFICVKGDFFKVLSEGELSFLQKKSDASGKPTYNGNEASFSSGTEGKLNDYFIYNNCNKQLRLVSKKNVGEIITASFSGYTAAIDKANAANGDLSQLKDAVDLYNHRNK